MAFAPVRGFFTSATTSEKTICSPLNSWLSLSSHRQFFRQNFVVQRRKDPLPIVIVLLAPPIERMVVALRALDAAAKELGRGLGALGWKTVAR